MTYATQIASGWRNSLRWLPAAAMVVAGQAGAAAPAPGDAYVYRVVNAYNKEVRGQVRHEVARVESGRVTESVSPDTAEVGIPRTVVYNGEGNWLQHEVESHGFPVEYRFTAPYPAYVFPLEPGKSWSMRVDATVPGDTRTRSVRVDGKVMGTERIRVPAGEFDTIKVRRFVYTGDAGEPIFSQTETQITEVDWYAPALGRRVKTERNSGWLDMARCGPEGSCDFRGDWSIYELVEAPSAKR